MIFASLPRTTRSWQPPSDWGLRVWHPLPDEPTTDPRPDSPGRRVRTGGLVRHIIANQFAPLALPAGRVR